MDSDTPMSSHDFSIKKLEDSCKLLCRDMGFKTVAAPVLSKLTAILRFTMEDYSEGTRMMMENASRTKPIVTDVVAALKMKGVKMEEIVEYAKSVNPERLCSLPIYPAPDPDASSSDAAYFQAMYGPPPSAEELQHRPDHIPPYSRAEHSEFNLEKVKKEKAEAPSPVPQSSKRVRKQQKTAVFPNLEDMDFEASGLYKVYEENRRFMEFEAKKENAAPKNVQKPAPKMEAPPTVPATPPPVKPVAPPPMQQVVQASTPAPPEIRHSLKIKVTLPPMVRGTPSISYSSPMAPAVPPMASAPMSRQVPIVPPKVPTASAAPIPRPASSIPNILKKRGRPPKPENKTPSAQKQEPIHSKVLGFLKKDLGRSLFSTSSSSGIVAAPLFTSSIFSASKDIPSTSSNPPMEPSSKDIPSCPPIKTELLETSHHNDPLKDVPSTSSNPSGEKEKKPKRDKNSEEYKEYKRQKKERKRREKEERRQRELQESQASEPTEQPEQSPMPKLKLRIKFGSDNLPTSSAIIDEPESPEVPTPLRLRIKFDGPKKEEKPKEEPKEEPKPAPRKLLSSDDEEEEEEVLYICPVCSVAYNHAANMVSCDKCEEWFHWHCVGITSEPTEEQWFCKKCSKSIKRSKKRSAAGAATSDMPAKRKKR